MHFIVGFLLGKGDRFFGYEYKIERDIWGFLWFSWITDRKNTTWLHGRSGSSILLLSRRAEERRGTDHYTYWPVSISSKPNSHPETSQLTPNNLQVCDGKPIWVMFFHALFHRSQCPTSTLQFQNELERWEYLDIREGK